MTRENGKRQEIRDYVLVDNGLRDEDLRKRKQTRDKRLYTRVKRRGLEKTERDKEQKTIHKE